MKKITIKAKEAGRRLDKFLAERLNLSRSQVQKLIKSGAVLFDDRPTNPHHVLKEKEVILVLDKASGFVIANNTITKTKTSPSPTLPKFKLSVIIKTPDYLVIDKPAGIPVHPDNRYPCGTLIDAVIKKYPEVIKVGEERHRAGIIHRLDKDVSGLLVVPRTQNMFDHLKLQFKARGVVKEYLALVHGRLAKDEGEIDFPIIRGVDGIMVARPHSQGGKRANTSYQIIKKFVNYSLVKVKIKTGRTHQIRVHFKALGHPVVGDSLHTIKKQKADKLPLARIFLHSATLGFRDLKDEYKEFHSDLPEELKEYLIKIK